MKNERSVYTIRGCIPFILFSSCKRKNGHGYNESYLYFSFFVWGLEKTKRMLSYSFSMFYYEIEKRITKGWYVHGPRRAGMDLRCNSNFMAKIPQHFVDCISSSTRVRPGCFFPQTVLALGDLAPLHGKQVGCLCLCHKLYRKLHLILSLSSLCATR